MASNKPGRRTFPYSLTFWLRENCDKFGVEPDSKEFFNTIAGLSRVKRSMLGKIKGENRPCLTYKGWRVLPTEYDEHLKETKKRKKNRVKN